MRRTFTNLRGALGAGFLALAALSCSDRTINAPDGRLIPGSGTRDVAPGGAFTWLPPIGTGTADPATFDASAVTSVDICLWISGACSGAPVAQFSTTPAGSVGPLTVNKTVGQYEANWNLLNNSFLSRKTYRIRALRGTTEVGAISVDVIRGRWALTRSDGTFGALLAANELAIRFHVALPPIVGVKINEIESNGGTPDDWVELYNPTANTIDLSGFEFRDNDDTHHFFFPAGTTIAAGAYLVIDGGSAPPGPLVFNFGLGAGDQARLFDQFGRSVDSYTWTAHAATTYGRCPNGTGAFTTTTSSTKGAANDCTNPVKINEIESNGGSPDDWVEFYNPSTIPVDLSGYEFRDNDDTHHYFFPSGTIVAPGAYLVLDGGTAPAGPLTFGFGLGAGDQARLFDPTGHLVDSYTWTAHAATTYGRCPNGTGSFVTTTSSTKGTANDCSSPIKVVINEIESNGGSPDDWVELYNAGTTTVNVGGFEFRDNDDTHHYFIPAGTMMAPGGYLVLNTVVSGVGDFNFGLGAADAARLFDTGGHLIDSYSWTAHAAVTYGRCPNGTGDFVNTVASTKGSANSCPSTGPTAETWPGSATVAEVDNADTFTSNLSGLIFESAIGGSPDVLWGARNGPEKVYRLILSGGTWIPDPANGWGDGKQLRYSTGTGQPDTEDLTFTTGSAAGMYTATERDNANNAISRPAILRYDVSGSSTELTATNEWNLTADLPGLGANLGLEGITWIPNDFLTTHNFFDASKGHAYNPAEYPNNGAGLFIVGVEQTGVLYVYSLNHADNTYTRIASIATSYPSGVGVMAVRFDPELGQLWAICDDTCHGAADIFVINASGNLQLTHIFNRPAGMPDTNNEGFTMAPQSKCSGGFKPAFWSDDNNINHHAIRAGTVSCLAFSAAP